MSGKLSKLPEIAWQYNYGAGLMRTSWDAMLGYGIGLTIEDKVAACPPREHPEVGALSNGYPSMNVTMVTLSELVDINDERGPFTKTGKGWLLDVEKGRLMTYFCFPVGANDPLQDQQNYFRGEYANSSCVQQFIDDMPDIKDGFQKLARPLLVLYLERIAAEGMKLHALRHPSVHDADPRSRERRAALYRTNVVGLAVRQVLLGGTTKVAEAA